MGLDVVKRYVVLVNEDDEQIGVEEKLAAHKKGLLHRAFSVFITNDNGEMLLQKRAASKYHSPNLWTNACCSHPGPDESLPIAIQRRLLEELNLHLDTVDPLFSFIYKAKLDQGLTEYEFDHVWVGNYNEDISPNPEEVDSWGYFSIESIKNELSVNPENYTFWFKEVFERVSHEIVNQ